ncbi:hypothetical protein BHE74_00013279 [Ensete ventricosum]|nr:hypothetical protein BHE74_00013279 [Ensete ventricosum]
MNFNTGILLVDFVPDIHLEDVKYILCQHKDQLAVRYYGFHSIICKIIFSPECLEWWLHCRDKNWRTGIKTASERKFCDRNLIPSK